jgi:hypothetical protein
VKEALALNEGGGWGRKPGPESPVGLAYSPGARAATALPPFRGASSSRRAGVNVKTVNNSGRGSQPLWHVLVRLVRVLGPALVTVDGEAAGPGKAGKRG